MPGRIKINCLPQGHKSTIGTDGILRSKQKGEREKINLPIDGGNAPVHNSKESPWEIRSNAWNHTLSLEPKSMKFKGHGGVPKTEPHAGIIPREKTNKPAADKYQPA